jgi:hypothetical protein
MHGKNFQQAEAKPKIEPTIAARRELMRPEKKWIG